MIILLFLLFSLHVLQFYLREIFFFRYPKSDEVSYFKPDEINSPVDGTVVYVNEIIGTKNIPMIKEKRMLSFRELRNKKKYWHIGIYMSPLSNHHVLSPFGFEGYRVQIVGEELFSMLSSSDLLNPFTIFKKDWTKKLFTIFNKRLVYYIGTDAYMVMIFDKYVSSYTPIDSSPLNGRSVLGFVGRGSQMDLFLPMEDFNITVEKGDRVKFSKIGEII